MLSAEKREKARERWMEMFDAVYSKNESLFSWGTTLVVADTDTLVCYGEDGLAYTLQAAPWEREDE